MKKNIISAVSLFIMFLLVGCEGNLDLTNPNEVTSETFWNTEQDFQKALTTCYTPLKIWSGGYYGTRGLMVRLCRADDFSFRTGVDDIYTLHMFTNSNSNSVVTNLFSYFYEGIYRANLVLEKLEEKDFSEDTKKQIKGEALFMRGLYYFFLAKEFGNVPIRLKASQLVKDFPLAKSAQADVYAQAESDLKLAAGLLPLENGKGKPTAGAANAFLGKLYVYTEQWENARKTLKPLTQSPYTYRLVDDYTWNFDEAHEYNSESIFEVIFDSAGGTDQWDGGESANTAQGTTIAVEYAAGTLGGWFMANIYPNIMPLFLQEKTAGGDIDYRVKTSIAWNYPGCTYYQKPIQNILTPVELESYWLTKYQNSTNRTQEVETEPSYINERAMRFADVLLLLAECELELPDGDINTAIGYINQIRTRGGNLPVYSGAKDAASVKKELIRQRAIEFFREGERFYDLRRWGLLEQALQDIDETRASFFDPSRHYYLPIPAKELQTNPLCTQNGTW